MLVFFVCAVNVVLLLQAAGVTTTVFIQHAVHTHTKIYKSEVAMRPHKNGASVRLAPEPQERGAAAAARTRKRAPTSGRQQLHAQRAPALSRLTRRHDAAFEGNDCSARIFLGGRTFRNLGVSPI